MWEASPDHSIRNMIYSETFDSATPNFTGHSGYTQADLSIDIDKGWGVYVICSQVGNPKPQDLNCIVWTRQR